MPLDDPQFLAMAAGGAAVLLLAVWLGVRLRRRLRARPAAVFRRIARAHLRDIVIPDGLEGEIQLDHVLLTARGAVVVDLRNAHGAVFSGRRLDPWTVMHGARRFTFRNPLDTLDARVQAVRRLCEGLPVTGRVVFVGRVSFPRGRTPGVVTLDDLEAEFMAAGEPAPAGEPGAEGGWARLADAARRA